MFFKLLRIHQYTKNVFVFAALFFSGNFSDIDKLTGSIKVFFIFCLAASSIYLLNDIRDIESDKQHPEKRHRPLAAGKISIATAVISCLCLGMGALFLAFFTNLKFGIVLLSYFILNISYCFGIKHISILDVVIVATGFVLRVLAGGVVCDITVSHWLIIMTFLLALFIAFAKRSDDLVIKDQHGIDVRRASEGYSSEYISTVMSLLTAILIVCYIMYITSAEVVERFSGKPIYISTLFVILGVLRYLQISIVEKKSGSPSKVVLKDIFLQVIIVAWLLFFLLIIYLN